MMKRKDPIYIEKQRIARKGNKYGLGHIYKPKKEVLEKSRIAMKKIWENPISREKMLKAQRKAPNKSDQILIDCINKNHLPYKYTGNRAFWIGRFNPDFINTNNKKILIEKEGCFYHNCPVCYLNGIKNLKLQERVKQSKLRDKLRDKTYIKNGWKIIKIWEHELNNLDLVIKKINSV
jgi:DNA mismatch endonuclease (patch repair protein)